MLQLLQRASDIRGSGACRHVQADGQAQVQNKGDHGDPSQRVTHASAKQRISASALATKCCGQSAAFGSLHEDHQNHHSGDHHEEAGKDVEAVEIVHAWPSALAAVTALMMLRKSADFNEAPPTRNPSTSGLANNSAALAGLTEPPYWIRTASATLDHSVLRGRPEGRHGPLGHPQGWRSAGADGPYRFVGNDQTGEGCSGKPSKAWPVGLGSLRVDGLLPALL